MTETQESLPISAEPTKSFFIDMLTRDIGLEQAVLDLVDNSVDGAKGHPVDGPLPFEGRTVTIEFDKSRFLILDNCGGFGVDTARDYAFRFGRPPGSPRTRHSIGQFGVGMKRALFKFGDHFSVRSATTTETWAVDVNVPDWEKQGSWNFPWADFGNNSTLSTASPGTEIIVTELRKEVGWKFSTKNFENSIISLIKSKHRQFIAEGLAITVNGNRIAATNLLLLVAEEKEGVKLKPGIANLPFQDEHEAEVKVRIIVGVGPSAPREAGWYVVCNGRVIVEADRSTRTGWGLIEEESNSLLIPSYHNQFARFRGIVSFDSDDSSRVPWNTTKTDVDQDSPIWRQTRERMLEMMRPVITFLNELDTDIDEHTREHSPLLDYVSKAATATPESFTANSTFSAPARGTIKKAQRTIKIQYSRPVDQVELLMSELSVSSAKAVGEHTFDLMYKRLSSK